MNILPYLGKRSSTDPPERNLAMKIVQEMAEPIEGTGRNITTDNFFTSLALARDLKRKRLTLVGTMRSNRKEIPTTISNAKSRPVSSSVHVYKEEAVLMSYKPKANKNVILLSSMHSGRLGTIDAETNKPEIVLYYNSTKGGVDNFDKLAVTYSVKRKTRRWPMCVFSNIIDISAINAFVIWKMLNPNWNAKKTYKRRLFLIELGKSLADYVDPPSRSMTLCATNANAGHSNQERKKRGRCFECPRSCDKKVTTSCSTCSRFLCTNHMFCNHCRDQ